MPNGGKHDALAMVNKKTATWASDNSNVEDNGVDRNDDEMASMITLTAAMMTPTTLTITYAYCGARERQRERERDRQTDIS